MSKEAVDRGLDYVVSVDEQGRIGEGPTENIALVTSEGVFLTPEPERVLMGTTLRRLMALAETLKEEGVLTEVRFGDFGLAEAQQAREAFITGTTRDLVPVVEMEGCPVGAGRPGPLYRRLLHLLREDMNRPDILP